MGKRYTVFDDLDDKLDADRTYTFSLDGTTYEIDLHQTNIDELNSVMARYVTAARRTSRSPATKSAKKEANPELDAIRHWAGKNGYRVSNKGRIPGDVKDAYEAAHAPTPTPPPPAKAAPAKAATKVQEPAFSAASK